MKKITKVEKFYTKAMNKMFRAVGLKRWDKKFTQETADWYSKYNWTEEEADKYREWFVTTARKDMKWSKKTANFEFGWFFLCYGWRLSD
jgi:hypothetical protein